ncbi:insulin-like growth factor-binding protein 2-B [Solea senegalensis]|uniref:Insulin-like growth factor-binding protein 2-B n=1 Tax=Solea senegalensis TaxID=28829 RepID=A0AAV6RD75_SOLSE|nr:insulin-like growth factor-binding protein 2-B isoform X1 [Solea senegalensis]KAG7502925.1 insulin-like growth factor-binding protein 2-B [Solea senegalensis]
MVIYFTCGLLLAYLALPGTSLGDLVFRCPSCTAERLAACPKVTAVCAEIVREPGCGCCPMCARLERENCGVYTPRCSTGLRCYPTLGPELPLQQLIQGLGQCQQVGELDSLDHQATNEVHGTENPLTKRPPPDAWLWQESARKQHSNERKTKMRVNQVEDTRTQTAPQGACQEELDNVLLEISRMTSEDNRGSLENLYLIRFPNCDIHGLYNPKQCNISTHGQRGECWCVNPYTGVQIPATPRIRGDPNCYQYQEDFVELPTEATYR